jgi:hypothetical protein
MIIEIATSKEDILSIHRLRRQVFQCELGRALPALSVPEGVAAAHLFARAELTGETVAALTIMETTKEVDFYEQFGLRLKPDARVARYTQLAVSKPYRGMDLPLMLILEAHYHFVAPGGFTHTWLLFDADRASNSSLCRRLGFSASSRVFPTPFGVSRILVRDEQSAVCEEALRQTQRYLTAAIRSSSSCHYCTANGDQLNRQSIVLKP